MKVVYLHQYFNTLSSSSATRSYEMARRLADRGHDVHIVTSSRQDNRSGPEVVGNFTVHWHPVPYSQHMSYTQRLKAFFAFAARSAKTARALHGDVVFATSTPLTIAIPGIIATAFRRRPLVFEVRDLWPDVPIAMGALDNKLAQFVALVLEKATYRYSSHIVALSPDMKDAITRKNIPSDKVTVIPNASDNELFETSTETRRTFRDKCEWLQDRKLVLYCGSLGRVNDVSYIVRLAAATWELDKSIRFLVVGKGNDEERVRDTAKTLGVYERNFFMMNPVPKTKVPAIFAAADISMSTVADVPILSANSANKVFDTFASGTPLVINHGGWLAELLHETRAGLVLKSSNMQEVAAQVVAFLNSPQEIKAASRASRDLATGQFARQELADQLGEILEKAHMSTISFWRRGRALFSSKRNGKHDS